MNKAKIFFFIILFSTIFHNSEIDAQRESKIDFQEMDAYFTKMVKDWDVPGASIGIVKDGELVFSGNYGVKEVGKADKPDKHSLYAIASNSKAFTATLIGMLVEEGKLDWNDPVRKHLPDFTMYDNWVSEHITIRDILSHRVGLGTFSGDNIWYKSTKTAAEIVDVIQYVPQAYEFRSGYGYSNLMYITAGEIIRAVTGKSWGENVQDRILKPLGMDRTISALDKLEDKGNFSTPHARKDRKNYAIPWVDWKNVEATGGLISSIEDMSKWIMFNLNHGIHNGDTLISKRTRNMIWTPHNNFTVDHTSQNDFDRHFNAYGLGWSLSDYQGRLRVGHTGGYDGFITAVNLIPDENLGVIVLTNGVKSPIMAATYYTLDKMLGIKGKDWSEQMLFRTNTRLISDTRIPSRISKRVKDTKPSISIKDFSGDYHSDLVGKISIVEKGSELILDFEEAPLMSAKLTHWHYDVWQIHWEHPQAWFSFGTIKINTDNQMKVVGFDFDVPNDDFFFEELKPRRE